MIPKTAVPSSAFKELSLFWGIIIPEPMFFIKGTRTARIKVYPCHSRQCENCNDFDLTIGVFHKYFHVFFVPVIAKGLKSSVIYCNSCGSRIRSDSLSKEYESKTGVPLYLYSGLLLVGLVVLAMLVATGWGTYERSKYISDPKIGDVYLMKAAQGKLDGFRFVRVSEISGDSVTAVENNVLYLSYTSFFASEDYFDSGEQAVFSKSHLKHLYKADSIETIFRNYGNSTGFNRIK